MCWSKVRVGEKKRGRYSPQSVHDGKCVVC